MMRRVILHLPNPASALTALVRVAFRVVHQYIVPRAADPDARSCSAIGEHLFIVSIGAQPEKSLAAQLV